MEDKPATVLPICDAVKVSEWSGSSLGLLLLSICAIEGPRFMVFVETLVT